MLRPDVKPELLQWARQRANLTPEDLGRRFPKLTAWEQGEAKPTLRQLEDFARTTHAAIGYFFLPEPPVERMPIPDFRTVGNKYIEHPSPDLLDTLYLCQQRQTWYADNARGTGAEPLKHAGAARTTDDIVITATAMRDALGLNLDERRAFPTWTDALRRFIEQADAMGILVMVSGVVGSNSHRRLDPDEFRGFALADPLAPLVFVNGADTKAAQMFTLAHELAHIWLGQSAVSDAQAAGVPEHEVERWCNQVAAELLVPLAALRREYRRDANTAQEATRLARHFKVSTLVILRRMHDAGGLTRNQMWDAYQAELERLRAIPRGSGGDFYLTLGARASKTFARALVVSTLEGRTSFTEAFRLLGFKKMATFREVGQSLGLSF
jgi:Zn-dependent peptidase ImmA (M78 family)/transcriptional regulator with XRE-family HTH domain